MVISQIEKQCHRQPSSCAVTAYDDILRGNMQVLDEPKIRQYGIMELPGETHFRGEAIVEREDTRVGVLAERDGDCAVCGSAEHVISASM